MSRRKVGFGIIGCGNIGPTHADAINQVPGACLVAVSDVDLKKARRLARKYRVDAYTDYREMLKRKDIDVVCLCVPSGMRLEIAKACAEAGKYILCEKPLEVTTARIDRLIKVAEDAGVTLACVFQSRFAKASRLVKKAIEQGRFGRPILANAYIKWFRSDAYYASAKWRGTRRLDGGGALMNQGIHQIDLLLWFMGNAKSVQAVTKTVAHEGLKVEDLAVARVDFANGAIGTIEGSTAIYPGHPARVEIHGTEGSVVIEDGKIVFWKFKNRRRIDRKIEAAMSQESELGSAASDPMKGLKVGGHLLVIQDLVWAIRYGREPFVPGLEGRRAVELIEAIYRSACTGRKVNL
jgi:predicted dehydrogenase